MEYPDPGGVPVPCNSTDDAGMADPSKSSDPLLEGQSAAANLLRPSGMTASLHRSDHRRAVTGVPKARCRRRQGGPAINLGDVLRAADRLLYNCIKPAADARRRIVEGFSAALERLEVQRHLEALGRFAINTIEVLAELHSMVPSNLHGLGELERVASLSLEEGIPVAWVPRRKIIQMLIDAPDASARRQILVEYREDIINDCRSVLDDCRLALDGKSADGVDMGGELADQCLEAINAFSAGLYGPAQSHAANIIDSILGRLNHMIGSSRESLLENARRDFNTYSILVPTLVLYLTLRPINLTYVRWHPESHQPPPAHFARHPTVHALGHPGLFTQDHALVALMLATSLTRQFSLYTTKRHFYTVV